MIKTTKWLSRSGGFICVSLLALGLFAACATTVHMNDENGTVGEYKFGYLYFKPAQPLEKTHAATKKAFKDLGYLLVGDDVTPGEIEVHADDSHNTSITVDLKDFTTFTRVKIRCGTSGDLSQEQEVYQAIERNF